MSNSTQAPGWWQATDGNWYPPESHPDATPRLAPTPPPPPPAGWIADPMLRHEHRYWDGSQWTDHVSDGGVLASDALLPPSSDPIGGAATVGRPGVRAATVSSRASAKTTALCIFFGSLLSGC